MPCLQVMGGGIFCEFDLSCPENIPILFEEAKRQGYVFDGMIYCAGISPLVTLADCDLSIIQKTYNINLMSFVAMLKYFMNDEYTNPGSSIVVVSSSTAIYGGNRQYVYGSSKAAINSIVTNCSGELTTRGSRLNAVMPSITNTEMVANLRKQSDAIDANVRYKMPFGILQPEDIVNAILHLLSDDCTLNGVALPVNNGEIY